MDVGPAQNYLGNLYIQGTGVKQDQRVAVEYFVKSAKNGYSLGQFNLGMAFYGGVGVKQDLMTSYVWFKTASNCYPKAESIAEQIAKKLTPEIQVRGNILANQYLSRFGLTFNL